MKGKDDRKITERKEEGKIMDSEEEAVRRKIQ